MIVYILTREINEYRQDGEYFVAVFKEKPSTMVLFANGVPFNLLEHVYNGGGRTETMENEWFYLREHEI